MASSLDLTNQSSEALRMTAAAVCLSPTSRIPAMRAAILFTGGCRTFARCVSAFVSRLGVIHFLLLYG